MNLESSLTQRQRSQALLRNAALVCGLHALDTAAARHSAGGSQRANRVGIARAFEFRHIGLDIRQLGSLQAKDMGYA